MKFFVFLLSVGFPLLAQWKLEERAEKVRQVQGLLGNVEKNPGARERRWKAKRAMVYFLVGFTTIVNVSFWPFVHDSEAVLIIYVLSVLIGFAIAKALEMPVYDWLDARETGRQIAKALAGEATVINTHGILGTNPEFESRGEEVKPQGEYGTAQVVNGASTDLADHRATVAARNGGR